MIKEYMKKHTEEKECTITDPQLGIIATCAIRYAMGRKTYMPSLVIDFVKRNWKEFTNKDKTLFLRDVEAELRHFEGMDEKMGMDYDHQGWVNFKEWMENELRP